MRAAADEIERLRALVWEQPCATCDGKGYDEDEDGKHPCHDCEEDE